jgi:hypothetical protein
MTRTFRLVTADGAPADPPSFTTVAPKWEPGDMIPLGERTLRVIGVRNIGTDGVDADLGARGHARPRAGRSGDVGTLRA